MRRYMKDMERERAILWQAAGEEAGFPTRAGGWCPGVRLITAGGTQVTLSKIMEGRRKARFQRSS